MSPPSDSNKAPLIYVYIYIHWTIWLSGGPAICAYVELIAMQLATLPYKSHAFLPSAETGKVFFLQFLLWVRHSEHVYYNHMANCQIYSVGNGRPIAGWIYSQCEKENCYWKTNS